MAKKPIKVAIAYAFDGTLAPGNMQERDFIPAIGTNTDAFWREVKKLAREHESDEILAYMGLRSAIIDKIQIDAYLASFS